LSVQHKKKQPKAAAIRTSLNLQVSGQTLAELQEIYNKVLVQTALDLRCECEFPTLPSALLENGSLIGNEVLSFDFKDGDRLTCWCCRVTEEEGIVACSELVYQSTIQQAGAFDESLCSGPLLADALSDASYGRNNDERCWLLLVVEAGGRRAKA
jgi:hypothetical protein